MITLRPVQLPTDEQALLRLDTSFVTDRIYRVASTPDSFRLIEETTYPTVRKTFDLTGELDANRLWHAGYVAQRDDDELVGFAAVRLEEWNRRAAIWHLYVAPQQRGSGLGRQLLEACEGYARTQQSRCLWLETSSFNYPAIQFYRRVGFTLCGLDQTLYDPESEAGQETALYLSRPIT